MTDTTIHDLMPLEWVPADIEGFHNLHHRQALCTCGEWMSRLTITAEEATALHQLHVRRVELGTDETVI